MYFKIFLRIFFNVVNKNFIDQKSNNENQAAIRKNFIDNITFNSDNNSIEKRLKNLSKELMIPVWVYGLLIAISVFLGGLSIAAIGAYCCYKWQKSRMQSTLFNSSVPTLHAFNPTF